MFKDSDTVASLTPSVLLRAFSTAVEQDEQCMPMTSSRATCTFRIYPLQACSSRGPPLTLPALQSGKQVKRCRYSRKLLAAILAAHI